MGVETALALGSTVAGTAMQYGENRAARKRANQVTDQANNLTSSPLGANTAITSKLNSGQDSYLQYLRSDPRALDPFKFDTSAAFKQLQGQDAQVINDQANQLSASAGSLGSRFGSGFAAKSMLLRQRAANDINARNAGIAQSSFNNALNTGFADFTGAQGRQQQMLQLLSSNELGQRGQQLQALGLGAAQPIPGFGGQLASAGGDIASLLTLMKYLKNNNGSGPKPGPSGNLIPNPVSLPYAPSLHQ